MTTRTSLVKRSLRPVARSTTPGQHSRYIETQMNSLRFEKATSRAAKAGYRASLFLKRPAGTDVAVENESRVSGASSQRVFRRWRRYNAIVLMLSLGVIAATVAYDVVTHSLPYSLPAPLLTAGSVAQYGFLLGLLSDGVEALTAEARRVTPLTSVQRIGAWAICVAVSTQLAMFRIPAFGGLETVHVFGGALVLTCVGVFMLRLTPSKPALP